MNLSNAAHGTAGVGGIIVDFPLNHVRRQAMPTVPKQ